MNSIQLINSNLAAGTNIVNQTYNNVGNVAITAVAIVAIVVVVYKFFTPKKLPWTVAKILSCSCQTRNFEHNNASLLMNRCKMTLLYEIEGKHYKTNVDVDSDKNYTSAKEVEILYNPLNPYDVKMRILQSQNWIQIVSTVSIIISTISLLIWWFTHLRDVGKTIYEKIRNKTIY